MSETPTPRARMAGSSSVSPGELREWIDAVPGGVCVTLPNGVTIDKRLVLPSPPPFPPLSFGYECSRCRNWVPSGIVHTCRTTSL